MFLMVLSLRYVIGNDRGNVSNLVAFLHRIAGQFYLIDFVLSQVLAVSDTGGSLSSWQGHPSQ
jgi:hypothetical protein